MYPKVVHAKRSNNLFQAIAIAFWSRGPTGEIEDQDEDVLDPELELEWVDDNMSSSLDEIQEDGIILDAQVELADSSGGGVSIPTAEHESSPPLTPLQRNSQLPLHKEELPAERPSVQCSIPFAQAVPSDDGAETDDKESGGGQTNDNENAGEQSTDTTAAAASAGEDIDPNLRSILEERGIAVATFEQNIDESDGSREEAQEPSDVEILHEVTKRMSNVGLIPEPPLPRIYSKKQ